MRKGSIRRNSRVHPGMEGRSEQRGLKNQSQETQTPMGLHSQEVRDDLRSRRMRNKICNFGISKAWCEADPESVDRPG